jgi:hypothetical protein
VELVNSDRAIRLALLFLFFDFWLTVFSVTILLLLNLTFIAAIDFRLFLLFFFYEFGGC